VTGILPLNDLQAQHASIREELDLAIKGIIDSGRFILGLPVEQFESSFARFCGTHHAVGVASGTSALHLALLSCGLGPGDEVITTPLTFAATAEAIAHAGCRIVFADVNPMTGNLCPERVAERITPRTRAILTVHLYGGMSDVDALQSLADDRDIVVLEDAAQAHGARLRGRRAGAIGRAGCFSFYPGKNLGALGDGGALTTDDPEIASKVRRLRDHGRAGKYLHASIGFGERLDAIHAAVLEVKLRRLNAWTERRREIARRYDRALAGSERFRPLGKLEDSEHAHHLYVVRCEDRDATSSALEAQLIRTGIHYPVPLHLQPAFADGYGPGDFPVAEEMARTVLSLPMFAELEDAQAERVIDAVLAVR
jgi:dTDP-4-amino-4,6-dideoxygalactose transaminase